MMIRIVIVIQRIAITGAIILLQCMRISPCVKDALCWDTDKLAENNQD